MSFELGDRGRRHYELRRSGDYSPRPNRRVLEPLPSKDASLTHLGKKYLPPPPSRTVKPAEARHNLAAATRSGFDCAERNKFEWCKKSVAWTHPGGRLADNARDFISFERNLELEMGMKKRVVDVKRQRNGITVGAPGDKSFAAVDYAPNFFAEGGLIPGACIRDRRKGEETKAASYLEGSVNFCESMRYEEKVRLQELDDEMESVKQLPVVRQVKSNGGKTSGDDGEDSDSSDEEG